jgi:predicted translin family RNA/ssDNA-binding protein
MWYLPKTYPAEVASLSREEIVEVASRKLQDLHKEISMLEEKLKPLNQDLVFWWKVKKKACLELAEVKKVPYGVSGREVEWQAKAVSLEDWIEGASPAQVSELIAKLQMAERSGL